MEKALVSRDSVSKFVCSACGKYLSVAPVHISEDKYICGRCPSIGFRVLAFEEMAQYLMFPCVNENCKQTLAWGTVADHERECQYRKVPCPIDICPLSYELVNLVSHFNDFHKNLRFNNKVTIPRIQMGDFNGSKDGICLLVHGQSPYFVFTHRNLEKTSDFVDVVYNVSVFSVKKRSDNLKYNVSLTFTYKDSTATVATKKNQEVTFYNEHLHKLSDIQSKAVSKFESLHKCDDADVSLDLELYDPNYVEPPKVCESLIHKFECPICNEVMGPQVFLCVIGHSICSSCKFKVRSCPFCQSNFAPNSRNYFLEEVISFGKPQKKTTQPATGFPFNQFSFSGQKSGTIFGPSPIFK